jgi:hypothetical protein
MPHRGHILLTALLLGSGCGDIVVHPIRSRGLADSGPWPATQAPDAWVGGGDGFSSSHWDPPLAGDAARPAADNWQGVELCGGGGPRVLVDGVPLQVESVRATGSFPVFQFHTVGPTAEVVAAISSVVDPTIQPPRPPAEVNLLSLAEALDTRVYLSPCQVGPDCPLPDEWLSVAKGDTIRGWITFSVKTKPHTPTISLCLAVKRGPDHSAPSLPSTVVLFVEEIPLIEGE